MWIVAPVVISTCNFPSFLPFIRALSQKQFSQWAYRRRPRGHLEVKPPHQHCHRHSRLWNGRHQAKPLTEKDLTKSYLKGSEYVPDAFPRTAAKRQVTNISRIVKNVVNFHKLEIFIYRYLKFWLTSLGLGPSRGHLSGSKESASTQWRGLRCRFQTDIKISSPLKKWFTLCINLRPRGNIQFHDKPFNGVASQNVISY